MRSRDVDYQPGVIGMEEGDKAIKSVATNGLTWTFDAGALHVSEYQQRMLAESRRCGPMYSIA